MKAHRSCVRIALTIVTLAALALISSAGGAQEMAKVVRISWFGAAGPWVLAKANGDFERNLNAEVKWGQYGSGGDVLTALAADQVDISLLGSPPTVGGLIRGLQVQLGALEGILATSEQLI